MGILSALNYQTRRPGESRDDDERRVTMSDHTDIRRDTWIARLPQALHPYALLMRLDRPIGTWLLLLPGWWGIVLASGGLFHRSGRAEWEEWRTIILFGIGAVVMRGAGCIVNDLWDRDLDRQVTRTAGRPLASGAIGAKQAVVFLVILLLIGLAILLQLSLVAICLGVLSLPFIVLYPLMKRITWWPQAFLGLTFNFGALMGWAAMADAVAWPSVLMYAAGFFWALGYDTIYAHQDLADDLAVGIKSSARRLGSWNQSFVKIVYILCWLLLLASFIKAGAGWLSSIILLAALGQLIWQQWIWQPGDPASALRVFRSNRNFGLIVLLAASL
jgi:4-hydroxybenzoate polyprenyltransferase